MVGDVGCGALHHYWYQNSSPGGLPLAPFGAGGGPLAFSFGPVCYLASQRANDGFIEQVVLTTGSGAL